MSLHAPHDRFEFDGVHHRMHILKEMERIVFGVITIQTANFLAAVETLLEYSIKLGFMIS